LAQRSINARISDSSDIGMLLCSVELRVPGFAALWAPAIAITMPPRDAATLCSVSI